MDTSHPLQASTTATAARATSDAGSLIRYLAVRTIKQSYLSLQIIVIFVFFICFILSQLIKLQFKYHRLALNMYDYDIEQGGGGSGNGGGGGIGFTKLSSSHNSTSQQQPHHTHRTHQLLLDEQIQQQQREDRDGLTSLASTTTASHFSSSASKKLCSLLKRLLTRLFTKLATILLSFVYGYQFCQNCFIQQQQSIDAFTVFTHIFIGVCVCARSLIALASKRNAMNQLAHLRKLQQKQLDLFDPANHKSARRNYYLYYYSYLIKTSHESAACTQLKQHQANQHTFRLLHFDEMSLFVGFLAALYHLFAALKALELTFIFVPMLLTLLLLRFKSLFNGTLNTALVFLAILVISHTSSFSSISDIGSYLLEPHLQYQQMQQQQQQHLALVTNNTNLTLATQGQLAYTS